MKGERKLSLVKPPPSASVELPEGEPEVTEEELREAEALRMALDRGEDPFASALRAAVSPSPAAPRDLDAILARAMGDLDALPTAIEEREAERLRLGLEEHDALREGRLAVGPGRREREEDEGAAPLAVALRAAWAPSPIGAVKNDALVGRALAPQAAAGSGKGAHPVPAARAPAVNDAPAPISLRRFRLGPRSFATMSAVVAMAAGVFLFVRQMGQSEAPAPASMAAATSAPAAAAPGAPPPAPRIASRSTTDLFDATTPFPRSGGESARVDRIAGARAADLRANRFAAWGVR
jgi:hypothetical protein